MRVADLIFPTIIFLGAAHSLAFAQENPASLAMEEAPDETQRTLPPASAEFDSQEIDDISDQLSFPNIDSGAAHLIFYRQSRLSFAFMGCGISVNGVRISSLGNGRYFVMAVAPGEHVIAVDGYRRASIRLPISPDTRTFIRCSMESGFPRPNPVLSLEMDHVAKRHILQLEYVDTNGASEYVLDIEQ